MSTLTQLLSDWFTIAVRASRTLGTPPQGLVSPHGFTVWSAVDESQHRSASRPAARVAAGAAGPEVAPAAASHSTLIPATAHPATCA